MISKKFKYIFQKDFDVLQQFENVLKKDNLSWEELHDQYKHLLKKSKKTLKGLEKVTKIGDINLKKLNAFQDFIRPYVPPIIFEKASQLIRENKIEFPQEQKETTIFFGDIVSFTETVESLDPMDALVLLNIALSIPIDSIERHGGYVDKFLGDGLMALFSSPLQAIIAGIEIQYLFNELNEMRTFAGQTPIQYRIGINTGMVVMGNVGKKNRRDWTAIGDTVNTASRLERNCTSGQVLICHNTLQKTKESVQVKKKVKLKAKGKSDLLLVYYIDSVKYEKNNKVIELKVPD